MPTTRSVSEVKARLSDYIREAEHGEPVIITRHGRPVAALVGADELEVLERLRVAGPEAGLVSVAGEGGRDRKSWSGTWRSMNGSARATSPHPADPVPYLFDTDPISEVLRPKPAVRFVDWLATIPRAEQYTSAVTLGELSRSAAPCFRMPACRSQPSP